MHCLLLCHRCRVTLICTQIPCKYREPQPTKSVGNELSYTPATQLRTFHTDSALGRTRRWSKSSRGSKYSRVGSKCLMAKSTTLGSSLDTHLATRISSCQPRRLMIQADPIPGPHQVLTLRPHLLALLWSKMSSTSMLLRHSRCYRGRV